MTIVSCSQLIFLLLIINCCTIKSNANRYRRQINGGTNRNTGIPQPVAVGSIPTNQQNNQNHLIAASQPQQNLAQGRGFYNSPAFQPQPFSGEKPAGWFGTSYTHWVSNQDSELNKNKIATEKNALPNIPPTNNVQSRREDGGPFFLAKIAKQYASKGVKGFNFGQFETREGRGSVCYNHENFDGYVFGKFSCPLPASTGMNQLDQYCCGMANYQYCCNAQEFSQNQRGAFADNRYIGDQRFPKRSTYSTSTKRLLAVIIPIASFVVLAGIGILVFLYYKKFRKEQYRTRKLSGAIRLEDNYSIVPQDPSLEKSGSIPDEL
ncbi:unnamed protein product [Adineta steineri]|uniref:Shisa N-terminal domain-containing protein n=1 Tax=Adineta steineri TaxID=433720 RepID=A0A818P5M9_9BILA|nr:unnamed protein product [Adineta steineri]CAF3618566.1 unnamed protein product [Adineta steineri]